MLLAGCVHPITVTGNRSSAIDRDSVVIYYPDRPSCNFDTIGFILVEGGYYSLSALLTKMQSEAAAVGAGAIYVTHTKRLAVKEYIGSAKAIRCRA